MRILRHPVGIALMVLGLMLASYYALDSAMDSRPRAEGLPELSYFPNGNMVRLMAGGHSISWADIAWFQTVQYYGKHRKTDQDFHMMKHLASVIADLDPTFQGVFRFVGFSLGQEGHDMQAGLAVLKRAVAENPGNWQTWFDVGFLYFVSGRDYPHATYYLKRAAALPNSPAYVHRLAGWVAGKAGYTRTATAFWTEILLNTDNVELRQIARKYLLKLRTEGKL